VAIACNTSELTSAEEARLKQRLYYIMADEDGWRADAVGMERRFRGL
jgi:hypothetical protein